MTRGFRCGEPKHNVSYHNTHDETKGDAMAREATITKEQVAAVAAALVAGGANPTARAVRERLGGGSMATVLRMLQDWRALRPAPAEEPPKLPPGLADLLSAFVARETSEAKAPLMAALAERATEAEDLLRDADRAEAEISRLEAENGALKVEAATVAGRASSLEAALLEARTAIAAAEREAENAKAGRTLAEARLESAAAMASRADAALAEASRLSRELAEAKSAAEVATARLEASKEAGLKAEAREAEAVARAGGTEARLRNAEDSAASLRRELADLRAAQPQAVKPPAQKQPTMAAAGAQPAVQPRTRRAKKPS